MTPDTNRVKRIPMYCELIDSLFRGDLRVIQGLPDDATMDSFYHDVRRDSFWIVFHSSEFDPVAEGDVIPVLELDVVEDHDLRQLARKWRDEGASQYAEELEELLETDRERER